MHYPIIQKTTAYSTLDTIVLSRPCESFWPGPFHAKLATHEWPACIMSAGSKADFIVKEGFFTSIRAPNPFYGSEGSEMGLHLLMNMNFQIDLLY